MVAKPCMPMRKAFTRALLESNYLQADETPLQVMNELGRNNTSTSYMWVYQSAKPDKKVILFDYRETRQALWPKEILNGYQGYLQTDGYSGYDWVNQDPDIIHLGFRVEEDVAALNPHRPGRAQLTHPVLHTIRFAYSQRGIDNRLAA